MIIVSFDVPIMHMAKLLHTKCSATASAFIYVQHRAIHQGDKKTPLLAPGVIFAFAAHRAFKFTFVQVSGTWGTTAPLAISFKTA